MVRFAASEWDQVFTELNRHQTSEQPYGFPERRVDSVVFSSFNIRTLGNPDTRTTTHDEGRTQGAWDLLARYVSQCDLIAIQEVKDNLAGLIRLKDSLEESDKYALVVSDVTGARPGLDASQERLAYLYRWDRIERTELASDVSYDRRAVLQSLEDNHQEFINSLDQYGVLLSDYKMQLREFENGHRPKKPNKPNLKPPAFLTFMRTPHVASFQVKSQGGARSLPFLAVNAHLLYGDSASERKMEFDALVDWLRWRTKSKERLYHKNMILFGDLNLEFEKQFTSLEDADQAIKDMNQDIGVGYKVNFPFLDVPDKRKPHPIGDGKGRYLTTARMTQTYDQIGLFGLSGALPDHDANDLAGRTGSNGFDYGMFCFSDLFAKALHNEPSFLNMENLKTFVKRYNFDVSDHHPIWMRLPIPGT